MYIVTEYNDLFWAAFDEMCSRMLHDSNVNNFIENEEKRLYALRAHGTDVSSTDVRLCALFQLAKSVCSRDRNTWSHVQSLRTMMARKEKEASEF